MPGDLDAGAARLDRLAQPRLRLFRRLPRQVVPDNLKSGVVKACLYDPEINRTYAGMAAHYDTAIVPTRPRKPRDKAKVEVGVQVVERWILARLRNRRFFSLAELNQAIGELLDDLNARRTKHLGASRRQLFEALDQPALKPLPGQPYQYAEWKQRRAGLDYHVEAGPSTITRCPTPWPNRSSGSGSRTAQSRSSIRVSASPPTCAVPIRNRRHTTVAEHMPGAHTAAIQLDPGTHPKPGAANGPHTGILIGTARQTPSRTGLAAPVSAPPPRQDPWRRTAGSGLERTLEIGATPIPLASILKRQSRAPRTAPGHGRTGDRSLRHPRPGH